jgi:hypothetical protein
VSVNPHRKILHFRLAGPNLPASVREDKGGNATSQQFFESRDKWRKQCHVGPIDTRKSRETSIGDLLNQRHPGRERMNLPGGRLARVRYAPIAQFCSAAESGEGPEAGIIVLVEGKIT